MSSLLHEPDGVVQVGVAGWLRFVPTVDGSAVRAALLLMAFEPDCKEFSFTQSRTDAERDPFHRTHPKILCEAAEVLVRFAELRPALLFALAAEVPSGLLERSFGLNPLSCLVKVSVPGGDGRFGSTPESFESAELLWEAGEPKQGSVAFNLLETLRERSLVTEPFRLAGAGLEEAFRDPAVENLYAAGLEAVMRVPDTRGSPGSHGSLSRRIHNQQLDFPAVNPVLQELDWAGKLMPYQQAGVEAFLQNERLLLADDMGLGKTIQAIAALRILHARGDLASCLVVAPASVLRQWRAELDKWAPEMSAIIVRGAKNDREWQWRMQRDVKMVSYDTLRSEHDNRSHIFRRKWDVVIADEAQRAKNRNPTSAALKELRRARSWALTGTPIENDENELASILEFIDHDGEGASPRFFPGEALRARHRTLQLRRKKGDVLDDLPPKQIAMVPMELPPRQRASYDRAEQEGIVYLKSLGAEVGVQHVLELIMRLKQICNADPKTGQSCKLADIKERMAQLSAQGHKALVFSQYTSETYGVEAAIDHLREFNPLALTGDIPLEERSAVINRFRNSDRHRALVLSLRVGGLGLNLQEASYVFHLDRWWNPALERQAEDRTHRMGQTVKVNVIKYSCVGTIEERIDEILQRKQKLFDQLVDDVSLNLSARLSKDDLFGLFDLN
ncbi:MAG: DEAD/DEAH box helicase [Caldilineaceae bacterium SB0661_bin_34]|nr:DEAD/DEAH box helicase [Caldilineaceae bacterium SB0661_bin_34]